MSDTKYSAKEIAERTAWRRAVEAVIWGMPAVNFDLMFQAMLRANGAPNQVVYWSRPVDWKNQTLTPNPNVIYLMPMFDTKDVGPMVMEIPRANGGSITGSVDNAWQAALEDVGPAGVDKGAGGKYLILPPGYTGDVPGGYIPLHSDTYRSYALLRSNLGGSGDDDIVKAVEYGKRVRVYPLSQASAPAATTFVDAIDAVFDSTIPYDVRFFEALDRFVQHEPWLTRDKVMIDGLKSIGIEKGKAFAPDAQMKSVLNDAAEEAHVFLDLRYQGFFSPPYFKGTYWALPASSEMVDGMQMNFSDPEAYPIDDRGASYAMAFFSAKHLGTGQFYLMTIADKDGRAFDGAATYRLSVPANAPVTLYWSATAYDRTTHALIRDLSRSSLGSNSDGLQANDDGSIDVFFGPKAPEGKDANWVPTSASGHFEVLFRFYGPGKALFDKTWVLPNIEKVGQ